MTITLEDMRLLKNTVDRDIKNIVDRLKTKKQGLDKLTFHTIFEFFTGEEINDIMSKDEELRKLYKKAMDSQDAFLDVLVEFSKEWDMLRR